jgi:L-fuconolactonase
MNHSRHVQPGSATALVLLCAALLVAGCSNEQPRHTEQPQHASQRPRHIVDTHIHLYDTSRPGGVPWPPEKEAAIYRPILPVEFKSVAGECGVTATVVVEASPILADNDWVLSVTKDDPAFVALVASLKPDAKEFAAELDRLCKDPRFVGIRPRLDQPASPLEPACLKGLKLLAERGKTLDLLSHTFKLTDVAELAGQVPELRIVVNHLAGVHADGAAPPQSWLDEIAQLANHPNVYCKMSGIFQQSKTRPAPTDPAHYKPVFDAVWKAFGEDRIIYGSNWPVTNLAGDYASQFQLIYDYVASKGQPALENVFWRNANRVYHLNLK